MNVDILYKAQNHRLEWHFWLVDTGILKRFKNQKAMEALIGKGLGGSFRYDKKMQ